MRITAVLGLVVVAAFASPAFGQSFLGEWTATVDAPGGAISETVKAVKTGEGYVVTAKLVGPVAEGTPEAGPGTEIELNGDNFSYKRSVTIPGGTTIVITYSGVVSGDTFTGAVDMGFAKAPYTGVRIKDSG